MSYVSQIRAMRARYVRDLLISGSGTMFGVFGLARQYLRTGPIEKMQASGAQDLRLHVPQGHPASGNAVIDREHQSLSYDMNRLRAAITSRHPRASVESAIDAVVRGVVQHFQHEEAILASAGYPETPRHTALHRELVDGATTLAGQYRAGTLGVAELFQFLADEVFARHMKGADQEYLPYLASQH